jgi:uncharacterized protein (DUF1800 family)
VEQYLFPVYVHAKQHLQQQAYGNFRDLTKQVTRDPAMLIYLDDA